MKCLLGIDMGTSNLKAAVYNYSGELIYKAYNEIPMIRPHYGWAEQNPLEWLQILQTVIKEIFSSTTLILEDISAVGICGQSHGVVPVNRDKKILGPCITWVDKRTTKQLNWVLANIGSDRIFNITGLRPDNIYTMCKIMWIKENQPSVYEKAHKFLLPKDHKCPSRYALRLTLEQFKESLWHKKLQIKFTLTALFLRQTAIIPLLMPSLLRAGKSLLSAVMLKCKHFVMPRQRSSTSKGRC